MKKTLSTIIGVMFISSFFMPAYGNIPGWWCAYYCFILTPKIFTWGVLGAIYYALFNITNFLTIYFLLFLVFGIGKGLKSLKWIGGLLCLHLLSWLILHIFSGSFEALKQIKIGYYIWAFSIIVSWICYVKKYNSNSINS